MADGDGVMMDTVWLRLKSDISVRVWSCCRNAKGKTMSRVQCLPNIWILFLDIPNVGNWEIEIPCK
jgi:hypothetical protein